MSDEWIKLLLDLIIIGNGSKEGVALRSARWERKNGHTVLDDWLLALAVAVCDAWRKRVNAD